MKPDPPYLLLAVVLILVAWLIANWQQGLKLTLRKKPRSPLSSARARLVELLERLDPLIVVGCLFACQGAYGRTVTLPLVYLALLAFVISSPLFGRFDVLSRGSTSQEPACLRVVLRWGAIVAALLFLAYAFAVGAEFSRRVILTWFIVTPVALCLSQVVRLRSIQ